MAPRCLSCRATRIKSDPRFLEKVLPLVQFSLAFQLVVYSLKGQNIEKKPIEFVKNDLFFPSFFSCWATRIKVTQDFRRKLCNLVRSCMLFKFVFYTLKGTKHWQKLDRVRWRATCLFQCPDITHLHIVSLWVTLRNGIEDEGTRSFFNALPPLDRIHVRIYTVRNRSVRLGWHASPSRSTFINMSPENRVSCYSQKQIGQVC